MVDTLAKSTSDPRRVREMLSRPLFGLPKCRIRNSMQFIWGQPQLNFVVDVRQHELVDTQAAGSFSCGTLYTALAEGRILANLCAVIQQQTPEEDLAAGEAPAGPNKTHVTIMMIAALNLNAIDECPENMSVACSAGIIRYRREPSRWIQKGGSKKGGTKKKTSGPAKSGMSFCQRTGSSKSGAV